MADPARRVRAGRARRSSTTFWVAARTVCPRSRCWSRATGGWASTCAGSLPRGGPVVCEVLTNVLSRCREQALGRPSLTPGSSSGSTTSARGRFSRARPDADTRPASPAGHLGDAGAARAARSARRRSDAGSWRSTCSTPSDSGCRSRRRRFAANDPPFSRRATSLFLRRYWRGPTWVNAAWLLWLGLVRLGYADAAAECARRVVNAVREPGCASTTTRTRATAWAHATSPGPRSRWSSSIPTRQRPIATSLPDTPRSRAPLSSPSRVAWDCSEATAVATSRG